MNVNDLREALEDWKAQYRNYTRKGSRYPSGYATGAAQEIQRLGDAADSILAFLTAPLQCECSPERSLNLHYFGCPQYFREAARAGKRGEVR